MIKRQKNTFINTRFSGIVSVVNFLNIFNQFFIDQMIEQIL